MPIVAYTCGYSFLHNTLIFLHLPLQLLLHDYTDVSLDMTILAYSLQCTSDCLFMAEDKSYLKQHHKPPNSLLQTPVEVPFYGYADL